MKERNFQYKGMDVTIQEDHPNGFVVVGKRQFEISHHHMGGLPMWMSDEAFFATPDVMELARHFVDYIYLFDAPGRIVVPGGHDDVHDDVKPPPAKKPRSRKRKGAK